MSLMVGRFMHCSCKDKGVHVLIFGTCEHVTFCGRRHFADVMELRILRGDDYPR